MMPLPLKRPKDSKKEEELDTEIAFEDLLNPQNFFHKINLGILCHYVSVSYFFLFHKAKQVIFFPLPVCGSVNLQIYI